MAKKIATPTSSRASRPAKGPCSASPLWKPTCVVSTARAPKARRPSRAGKRVRLIRSPVSFTHLRKADLDVADAEAGFRVGGSDPDRGQIGHRGRTQVAVGQSGGPGRAGGRRYGDGVAVRA